MDFILKEIEFLNCLGNCVLSKSRDTEMCWMLEDASIYTRYSLDGDVRILAQLGTSGYLLWDEISF